MIHEILPVGPLQCNCSIVGDEATREAMVIDPGDNIAEADKVQAGSLVADVLHTPGHTEGSISLYFPLEKKLIAGDTLFAGSIGRTDLPGGSIDKIIESLQGKLLALPDETVVIPGHGPVTTIGEERESNPFLRKA